MIGYFQRFGNSQDFLYCGINNKTPIFVIYFGSISMKKKLDLRIQKTYLALENAFIKLLEEKPFESITTNELCDAAMIRRTTFYKHFEDKYDYFSFFISNSINRSRNNTPIEILKEDPVKYTELRLKEHLSFFKEHKKTVKHLSDSNMITFFLLCVQKQLDNELRTILKETGEYEPSPELDFTIYLYTGALLSSMGWLIEHPNTFSEKEIAHLILQNIGSPYLSTTTTSS